MGVLAVLVDIIMAVTVVITRVTTKVEAEAMEEMVMTAMVMVRTFAHFYYDHSLI